MCDATTTAWLLGSGRDNLRDAESQPFGTSRLFRSQVAIGFDLFGQRMLFDTTGVPGSLGWLLGALTDRLFEFVGLWGFLQPTTCRPKEDL